MLFIRTDANEQIATGHMMRCKTIAYELKAMRKKVTFLVSDDDSTKLLNDNAFPFRVLHTRWDDLNTQDEIECIQNILRESYAQEKEFPVMLVDSYYVKNIYFMQLKDYARIVFLDDLAEEVYDVDVLINCNITYENYFYGERYKGKNVRTVLGTSYVPLRRQFGEEKTVKTDYTIKGRPKILLMCGGADSQNVLWMMLNFFSHKADFDSCEYHVVTGAYHSHMEEMRETAQAHANIKLMNNVDDMAKVMKECDLAVIAASTVLYECCAVGLPAILFTVADNQIPDAEVFSERHGLPYLGDFRTAQENIFAQIYAEINSFVGNEDRRKTIGHVMHEIVDGNGSRRIAAIMARMQETGPSFAESADHAFDANEPHQISCKF